jgi:thiol-disulfide isomerase/thioredoxin
MTHYAVKTLLAAAMLSASAANSDDTVLLYVYADNCGACIQFNQEVGGIYPLTAEAKRMPMVKIDFDDWRAGTSDYNQCDINPIVATPTFIKVSECKEQKRLEGYSDDELFWMSIAGMLER